MDKRPIMLAAGGTGGHLFPAFALAEELGRRGIPVELATDMRGDRYGTGVPARKVHQIQSATLGGICSMWRNFESTAAADFAPQPGSPGKPSALSPTSAR